MKPMPAQAAAASASDAEDIRDADFPQGVGLQLFNPMGPDSLEERPSFAPREPREILGFRRWPSAAG
jgi:hypothetical protein